MEFRQLLKTFVLLYNPHTYVELGVEKGLTFNLISPLVMRAVAIDSRKGLKIFLNSHTEILNMTTDEAAEVFQGEIDFLFIDACHEKTQLLTDFQNFSQFVKPDTGLIFLHDTYPINKRLLGHRYCHNAWEAAWEIRQSWPHLFEIVTLPGPRAGLSIIRKAQTQLGWLQNAQ